MELSDEIRPDKYLKEQYTAVVDRFAGPIPVEEFLDELMPIDDLPNSGRLNFASVAKARTHEAVCRALMRSAGHLCPNFKFMHMTDRLNADILRELRPPVACYPRHTPRIREAADDWKAIEMFLVIGQTDKDPWCVDPNTKEAQEDALWEARARSIMYARAQFAHQMRVFAFSLAIYGRNARFFLWDRSGVLITDAFDYVARPQLLAQFLQKFNRLTVAERGWDATTRPATFDEEMTFNHAIEAYIEDVRGRQVPMVPGMENTLDKRYPCYKIRLDQEYCGEACEVLVRRPFVIPNALMGRSTQGYIGYHLRKAKLVFLKDYWTWDSEKRRIKEIDAYRQLKQADVCHMPDILYAGYVRAAEGADQSTPTALHGTKGQYPWAHERTLRPRVHTRIVQDIAYPIRFISGYRHMVLAFRDVLAAIQDAADKLRMLHCDISIYNVMLSSNGRGILNDWDNARYTNSPFKTPVGTWTYASILTLPNKLRRHTIQDDVEACFWTLIYQACSAFKYSMSKDSDDIFKIMKEQNLKRKFLLEGQCEIPHFNAAPLNDLFKRWRELLADYHTGVHAMTDTAEAIALLDNALHRTDWPDTEASHPILRYKSSSPWSVVEYVPGWSQEELNSLYMPNHFEVSLDHVEGLIRALPDGHALTTVAVGTGSKESTTNDKSPRRKRALLDDGQLPECPVQKRKKH